MMGMHVNRHEAVRPDGRRWSILHAFMLAAGLIVASVATAIGSTAAFAYFTAGGTGSGAATTGTPTNVTISTGSVVGAGSLSPGGTGDLVITATNSNSYPVNITAMTIGSVTGCITPAVSVTTPSSGIFPFTIPANTSSPTRFVIPGALTMGTGASNDCQGQTLSVSFSSVSVQR